MVVANPAQTGHTPPMLTGSQIKRCRQVCGLSQQNLADAIGVHRTTIARAEAVGDAIPDDYTSGNMFRTVQVFEAHGWRLPAPVSIGKGVEPYHPSMDAPPKGTARAKPKRNPDVSLKEKGGE